MANLFHFSRYLHIYHQNRPAIMHYYTLSPPFSSICLFSRKKFLSEPRLTQLSPIGCCILSPRTVSGAIAWKLWSQVACTSLGKIVPNFPWYELVRLQFWLRYLKLSYQQVLPLFSIINCIYYPIVSWKFLPRPFSKPSFFLSFWPNYGDLISITSSFWKFDRLCSSIEENQGKYY